MAHVLGSSYTTDYVIHNCFPEVDNVEECVEAKVREIPNAKSYWSLIARIDLKWLHKEDRRKYPSSIFIKIPTITANVRNVGEERPNDELLQTIAEITANGESFYRMMENDDIPGFPYPRYYHGEEAECLMDTLASWHAYVFDHPEKTRRLRTGRSIDDEIQAFWFSECQRLESFCPEWFEGRISPLRNYFTAKYATAAIQSYNELGIPPVIVHMDLNTKNVLWKKETIGTSKPEIFSIIDFQLVHIGNICEDICRILQIGISVDMRRKHEDRLLDRYYNKLQQIMGKKTPLSREQVHAAYRRVFPFVANFSLFSVVCYYSMYNVVENDVRARAEKQRELLSRAKGVVDDVYRINVI